VTAVTRTRGAGPRHTSGWRWLVAGIVIAAAAAIPILRFLVFWPQDQWQVDIEVYREAGVSLLIGRPIYSAMTEAPQLLPFTYPPFAAFLALPLALIPFRPAAWIWTLGQVGATTGIVWYAGYRLIHRSGRDDPLVLAGLTAVAVWLHPVADGIRFGQINAYLVLLVLMDLRRPRPGLIRRIPPGVFVGLAMSIKLTPGVFVVHYLLCRRWKEAGTALGTAAGVTLAAALAQPASSIVFWGGALQDPARLGPNRGTSNQSIRGSCCGWARRGCRGRCCGSCSPVWSPWRVSGSPGGRMPRATPSPRSPSSACWPACFRRSPGSITSTGSSSSSSRCSAAIPCGTAAD
jgi:alpha-1,2-mannosyltransferase